MSELPSYVSGHQIDREQVGNGTEPSILVELTQVRVCYARTQFANPSLGYLAVGHELGIALEDLLGKELVAWDLDPELAFQAEHDVQEIDGLGPQVSL